MCGKSRARSRSAISRLKYSNFKYKVLFIGAVKRREPQPGYDRDRVPSNNHYRSEDNKSEWGQIRGGGHGHKK